ncbi:MAG: hypothetical protein IKC22_01810 [Bacilli bacterium]|nr:hypothetical protein [Bacilli bacterium]
MEKISGRIRNVNLEDRTFEILKRNKIEYFYLTRSQLQKFKNYLQVGFFVQLEYSEVKEKRGKVLAYPVIGFIKLISITRNKRTVYFDMDTIKDGVKHVLNKPGNKMFIDLEFTMPPYNPSGEFESEIVEYGFIIEDENGIILTEESSLIEINDKNGVSDRTMDFLNLDQDDFKKASSISDFYNTFKEALNEYKPVIMVWGTNDIQMLNSFYEMNNLEPLTSRASFINLMQLMKNYFGLKSDVGLFKALEYFDKTFDKVQSHDALTDALVTSQVYNCFKRYANKK